MTNPSGAAGHQALLDAAREEFAERGFAGTSIRSLADRAGISMSVLYHYYRSKQELIEAIILEQIDEYFGIYEQEVAGVGDGPVERLDAVIRSIIRFQVSGSARMNLVERERRHLSAGFMEKFGKLAERATELIRGPIAAGIAAGLFHTPYPEETRLAITAMCNAVGDWYDPNGPRSLDEIIDRHIELAHILLGYRPRKRRS